MGNITQSIQEIVVAEYRNRFITWISDGTISRLVGDEEWVKDALLASEQSRQVSIFDNSFSYRANVHDTHNKVAVFAGLASFPLDEIKIRECPEGFRMDIKDAIHTDFFAEMIGRDLSEDEWVKFLSGATFDMDSVDRWNNKGHSLKQLIQMYSHKYEY